MSRFALDGFDNKFSKFNLYAVGIVFYNNLMRGVQEYIREEIAYCDGISYR